jgi:GTP-binding protein HflX
MGKGKTLELARLCADRGADLILFDHDLSPAQARNLEMLTGRAVLDRTQLILTIFALRARTKQAKMQVELAQLQYELPRFRHMWTHLSRIDGSRAAQAPVGVRGPGETQIEMDRRRARERIATLQRNLRDLERQKRVELRGRAGMFTIALVGYTNVGKSTLMNALTHAGAWTEDRLFATLDATTRQWSVGSQVVLLTDTVGFIRDLPHHLVASFHATLEEVRQAHLLLHVVDASHPERDAQIAAVQQVLGELGCAAKPALLVLNKVDRLPSETDLEALSRRYEGAVFISAVTGWGLEELKAHISRIVEAQQTEVSLRLPIGEGRWLAFVEERGRVLEREYDSETVRLRVLLKPADVGRVARFIQV